MARWDDLPLDAKLARAREATAAEREAQGLPRYVEDPAVLARLARLSVAGDPRAAGDRPAPSVVGERGNLSGEAA